jgi:ketosteroid isomerase-like protein
MRQTAVALRDTGRAMSEESTTPDPVELARESIEAEDLEAALSFYAPHAVWDASPWGMGVFEGQAAVRGFFEDWRSSYSGIDRTAEEIRDLGNGVTFAVILQKGRVVGSGGSVQLRYASVEEWIDDLIVRNTTYTDLHEARAAAERLAEERG